MLPCSYLCRPLKLNKHTLQFQCNDAFLHLTVMLRRPCPCLQALLEGISLSQPQPKIPSELIRFLGKTYSAWHIAIPLLESHVMLFPQVWTLVPDTSPMHQRIETAVAPIFYYTFRRAACVKPCSPAPSSYCTPP